MQATYEVLDRSETQSGNQAFARDVLDGLSRTPKSIPSMYFYDAVGTRLFQRIMELEEYYPTRSEREILHAHAAEIAAPLSAGPFRLVELGVGDGRKTAVLLRHFLQAGLQFEYVPIDICRQAIIDATATLRRSLDGTPLRVRGIVAEYFDALAAFRRRGAARNLVLFLGSNIGNFTARESRRLLQSLRQALAAGDCLLLGFDLKKDLAVLHRAYNDAKGVTREFNLNLLDRLNRELGASFDRRRFGHYGSYNVEQGCMESWLVSLQEQEVPIRALGRAFAFRAWEGIHVERSHKYDLAQIESLAAATGFRVRQHFFDARRYFADSLWQAGS
jgi:L-histidine Nalpha-methyltransferase